jgi:hypothetical protein
MTDNQFEFKAYTPPKQNVNVFLIIAGVLFASTVIYFSFNKNEVNNDVPITSIEVNNEQPVINESPFNDSLNNNVREQEYNEPISQVDLLNFITQYYTDISSNNFVVENYFSENVIQYINRKNTTPSDINSIHKNNNDFINGKSTIINDEINFDRIDGDLNYYNYWIDFNCFRKSKNKYQNCKVRVEIGIDSKNKIKVYRELEVTDLNFTTNEVSIERDPRSKDGANVFYDPNYTLFDLLTDEPILPNSEGEYDIWYSSNEDLSPYNIVLNKNELASHQYYKFKTKANCEQWCNNKKSNN